MSDEENTPAEPTNGNEQIKDVGVEQLAKAHDSNADTIKSKDEGSNSPDLGLLLDIPVTLSLELGSTRINLGDLLRPEQGCDC